MFGIPFSVIVEGSVALLLMLSIGYSVLLNERLKRLHADRSELKQMIADLLRATDLANTAIQELKAAATEADATLVTRLAEAEKFGVELANHVNAGQGVMERIGKIIQSVRAHEQKTGGAQSGGAQAGSESRANRAAEALKALKTHREGVAQDKGRAA